jgi:hypothetical protein
MSSAFRRTSTRSTRCRSAVDLSTGGYEHFEDSVVDLDSLDDPERTLNRLDAELAAWLNHPSNSTWSRPQNNIE